MELPELTQGKILSRYKRFFADVKVSGLGTVTAHCPNTGTMKSCWKPDAPVELSYSSNPKRKLAWTLERIDMGSGWIGVNTGRVNAIIAEGIEKGLIPQLSGYQDITREPRSNLDEFPRSRLDLKLARPNAPDAYIEVKNATYLHENWVEFPDAVTARGRKHIDVLRALVAEGYRAVLVFAINRPEGIGFRPARQVDSDYADGLDQAIENGVEVLVVRLQHTVSGITVRSSARYPYL